MRPEESIRDLSILVSTPTVMVAMMTGEVRNGFEKEDKEGGKRGEPTKGDDHGALDVVCYEGDFESSQGCERVSWGNGERREENLQV